MLQNIVKTFDNTEQINNEVAGIESCKYCTVKDIRILPCESKSLVKAQILYDYDMESYNKDVEELKNKENS